MGRKVPLQRDSGLRSQGRGEQPQDPREALLGPRARAGRTAWWWGTELPGGWTQDRLRVPAPAPRRQGAHRETAGTAPCPGPDSRLASFPVSWVCPAGLLLRSREHLLPRVFWVPIKRGKSGNVILVVIRATSVWAVRTDGRTQASGESDLKTVG